MGGRAVFGPSTGDPVGPTNRAALASTAEIVGYIGDDSRFETDGWDAKVIKALDDAGGGFCWTSEGHDKPWPSTVFVTSKIVQALGWLIYPKTKRGFFDVVWVVLANATGRAVVLPEVMIRHDNGTQGVSPELISQDERAYKHWHARQLPEDARKVRAVF